MPSLAVKMMAMMMEIVTGIMMGEVMAKIPATTVDMTQVSLQVILMDQQIMKRLAARRVSSQGLDFSFLEERKMTATLVTAKVSRRDILMHFS